MKLILNTIGLSLDIIGCILIFCESFKMAIRYEKDGPAAYVAQGRNNWFWRYCSPIGLIFLFAGFVLQAISNFTCQ